MGLSSSKHNAPGPSLSSSKSGAFVSRSRSGSRRVLKSTCLVSHGSDSDEAEVSDSESEKNSKDENKLGSCHVSAERYRKDKSEDSNVVNRTNSGIEWGESSFTNSVFEEGNASSNFSSGSLNPPTRFLSRFSFHPGNLSFRLSRGKSLRLAKHFPAPSPSFTNSNEVEEHAAPTANTINRNNRSRNCDLIPSCFTNRSPGENGDISDNVHEGLRSRNVTRENCNLIYSPINNNNNNNSDGAGIRHAERIREPVHRNVRFSRTLSVGRLRDRVVRRNTASDLDSYDFQQDREMRINRRNTGLADAEVEATSDENDNLSQQDSSDNNVSSSISNPIYGSQNNGYGAPLARETRYRDLVEHRSSFLERRRRIRLQVHALQRLESRFQDLSSHERSCVISGRHRGGHCTCRPAARDANSNDEGSARASISRIVMLAEALFEVLDEIHQQSVVLSSRPPVSCIGSVPAHNAVVESLPLKIFSKLKGEPCEDTAQCYICLVEYDDGDSMRILPCRHEFHRACVDKWLKEIHRVCPLCRGDVCRSESVTSTS